MARIDRRVALFYTVVTVEQSDTLRMAWEAMPSDGCGTMRKYVQTLSIVPVKAMRTEAQTLPFSRNALACRARIVER